MIDTPRLDLLPLLPELILTVVGVLVLLAAATKERFAPAAFPLLTLAGLFAAAAASVWLWGWDGEAAVLGRMVAADRFGVVARLVLLAIAAFGAVYGHHYFQRLGDVRGEFYALLLFATLGMTLITAAADLIVVFLALEILSLSLYVMVGFTFRKGSGEASVKYFLLGAFSSAFFLYGVAMAYGATGTTNVAQIARALGGPGSQAIALAAVGFLLVGFGFKVSAVPFHMWTPDVYQGAPTPVTAFMSAGTKVAAFFALIRVLDVSFNALSWDWTPVVWVLAAVSMVVGSVLAIAQTDVKRLLAYSSVAHAGFVLTAFTAANQRGIAAAMYYLVVYSLMILGAFGVVMLVSVRGDERTALSVYRGLGQASPVLAGLMTVFLLSLAGIPPLAGFAAKVGVFGAAISAGAWPLAVIGVLSSVAAAFVYLRVIVLMYMTSPEEEIEPAFSPLPGIAISITAVLTILFGILPGLLTGLLQKAAILTW